MFWNLIRQGPKYTSETFLDTHIHYRNLCYKRTFTIIITKTTSTKVWHFK